MSETSFLYPHQKEAVKRMFDGCLITGNRLCGKSRAALYYYFQSYGGRKETYGGYRSMENPADLYIITSAEKRNNEAYKQELDYLWLDKRVYRHKVVVDSWNNVSKYNDVENAFFIFDGNRTVSGNSWSHYFLKITKSNRWVMMSDDNERTWHDYIALFVANGFYRNKTEFIKEHVVFCPYVSYPKIDHYVNVDRLKRLRDKITVNYDECCIERKENDMNFNDVKIMVGNTLIKPDAWEVTQTIGEYPRLEIDTCVSPRNILTNNPKNLTITNVIFNPPATIVFWSDKTKTVVKCDYEHEPYDPEKGLAMAISRKMLGDNKREYYNTFLHWLKKWEKTRTLDDMYSEEEWNGEMYNA